MQGQVVVEDMVVLSILVTNISVVEIEKEGTGVANSANLNCSIVEVVDMEDNVDVIVTSKCIHFYLLCIVTLCLFWDVSII